MKKLLNRRKFARRCASLVAIAAFPVSASTVKLVLPKLDPDSGLATTLGYTHDVDAIPAQVLLAEHPNYAPGSKCSNCVYFQGGHEWGKCNIFFWPFYSIPYPSFLIWVTHMHKFITNIRTICFF